jgi:two-component system response regulator RegX3
MSDAHDTPPASGRVVVVEDDPLQAESLAFILRQEGYIVELAATGAEGLAAVARSQPAPDTVLLDVALPDLSGVEVARRLRAGSNVPIIMLTARRNEIDKITGLDAGADDYVTKPFSHGELLARIRAQIRRGPQAVGSSELGHGVYTIGGLRIDTGMRRLTRDERVIDVSAREFDILRLLAEAAGRVVERQQLFGSVWGPSFYGDERALDVYIRMIRKKIEPDASRPMYLHTVRGVGYRLAEEPVSRCADPPP